MGGFGGFGAFGSGDSGYGMPTASQLAEGALSEAGSAASSSGSPILGWFLTSLGQALFGGGGGLGEDVSFYGRSYSQQDPFTGSSYADPFTTETYGSTDSFTSGVGSITEVISVGGIPTEASLSDILAPFASPAPEDVLLASGDPSAEDVNTAWARDWVPQSSAGLSSSPGFSGPWVQDPDIGLQVPAALVPNAPSSEAPQSFTAGQPNLGQPLASPLVSQPATAQSLPPVASGTLSPMASDYNPAADRADVPDVYVPTYSYPPIDTWPTAGLNAPPITSSPSTVTPPPNAVTPTSPTWSNPWEVTGPTLASFSAQSTRSPFSSLATPLGDTRGAITRVLSQTYSETLLRQQLANQGMQPGVFVSPKIPYDNLFNPSATSLVEATLLASHSPNYELREAQEIEFLASNTPGIGLISAFMNPHLGPVERSVAVIGQLASVVGIGASVVGGELGSSAEMLGPELHQALGPSEEDVRAWYQLLRESGYQRHHVFAQDLEHLWEEIGFYEGGPYGDIHEYTIAHGGPLHNWLHSPTGGNWVPVQEKWLLEEAIPNGLGPRDAAQFVKDLYERLDIPFDPANLRPFSEGR